MLSSISFMTKTIICMQYSRQIINTFFYLKRSVVTIQQDLRNPKTAANAAFTRYA